MSRSVVVFELNEVPWEILDWFCAAHPESNIAALLHRSRQWTTVAADEGHLSPWVTWPTVHRGVANTEHGIGHFGQDTTDADRDHPTWFAHAATDGGVHVGVFGLLHTSELPPDPNHYAFWVPDTFAPTSDTHPKALEPFQAFNLSMARASARNVSTGIDVRTAARFIASAPRIGLSPDAVGRIVRQLWSERRTPERRVRRRSVQAVLAFDLFVAQLRRNRPEAAAFFTNHVAAAMHRYWAATFPDEYDQETFGFDAEWIARWESEIDAALLDADAMLGRLGRWCDNTSSVLVVLSSMGQHAAQGTPVGRQLYLRDLSEFMKAADVAQYERRPAMDPQVNVVVHEGVDRVVEFLQRLTVGGSPVEWTSEPDGFVSMTFGQADDAIGDVAIDGQVVEPTAIGLFIEEIEDEVASTGYHVPEGSLWVYDPVAHRMGAKNRERVSTTAVAPALLELIEVPLLDHHDPESLSFTGA